MKSKMRVLISVMIIFILAATSICSTYAASARKTLGSVKQQQITVQRVCEDQQDQQDQKAQKSTKSKKQQQTQISQKGNNNQQINIGSIVNINTKNNNNKQNNTKKFSDVGKDFWAYDAIMELAGLGVINGYTDNTFKPNEGVTRSQFATMLTKALKLQVTGNTQTFIDVAPSSWDYNAVEASKSYLTGYRTADGKLYFYGSRKAVREDMAVALVKALKINIEKDNGQLQQVFSDYDKISANLRDYVYTAYKNGIMVGSKGVFNPQGALTRAEAATLLLRALQKTDKVPVDGINDDGQKVVVDGQDQNTPKHNDATLSSLASNGTAIQGFSAATLVYNIVLPAGTTAVPAITATVHDTGNAAAEITQANALPGTATVLVIAQDGTTQKVYTINFTVAAPVLSNDAALSSLSFGGTAIAGFDPNTLTYNIILPAGTTTVPPVTAAVRDTSKATAVIVQAAALPGSATVTVTAQDGVAKKVYTVNFSVTVVLSTDATLSSLSFNGTAVAGFAPGTLTYNVVLPAGTTAIPSVTAVVNDTGKATMNITQAVALPGTANVTVTAQDGTTHKVYTINFTVSGS